MSRMSTFRRDDRGATAAEFAMVLPLLLLLLLGILDVGRLMWEYNRAEKATQMGVRYAVVTDMVPSGLLNYSFALSDGILAGQPVPTANFDRTECNTNNCSPCTGSVCGSIGYNALAFDRIVQVMRNMYPSITDANVIVEYRNVGLGYAGDPNGPDVAPLVTVRLTGLTFRPITTMLFGADIVMPDFRAALTLEDGSGTMAN
ncbi:TadE/TadG family type IV pilus assembly protein [Sphingomonas sp.]|uniref:TadE/TadG family type IV pilus assembly protein n=1 Tax=Sphingomonas sp. TaxID=28214 RepID=UPI0017D738BA|nr:TadE/TadG family type IV pilus assembly protein [Sphingomonas sp.]MBA3511798.1 pilus assembly protein [Sphingomonas sp.]